MLLAIVATTVILVLSIGLHELGHLLTAKRFGVHVSAFALGMGPVLWRRQIGETEYRLCLLPIGGYVRAARRADTVAAPAGTRTLDELAWWKQATVFLAGIVMNLLLLGAALSLQSVMQDVAMRDLPGQVLFRAGDLIQATIIGIREILAGPNPLDAVSSPVGIAVITGDYVAAYGFNGFLAILIAVNISLALFNLFPLPVLDGGQLFMATVEALWRRPISARSRYHVTMASVAVLLGLVGSLTVRDVSRLVAPVFTAQR
jgi:regulator of sigma E protease